MIVLNEHWINMEYWWILNLYKIYKIHKSSFRICEYYNYIQLVDVKTSGFVAEQGRAVFRSLPRDGKSCRTGLGRKKWENHMSIESIPRYSKKTHWYSYSIIYIYMYIILYYYIWYMIYMIYMIYNYVYIYMILWRFLDHEGSHNISFIYPY